MSIVEAAMARIKRVRPSDIPGARPQAPNHESDARILGGSPWPQSSSIKWSSGPPVTLDFDVLRAKGLYPPAEFAHPLQEEYRSIRREVINASRERIGPTEEPVGPIIVVTSALPGEGKSYTTLNIALSIASEDVHDVLLVDADTVKQSITRGCGLGDRPGLMELLARPDSSFAEHAYLTSVPRLRILPSGRRFDGSTDLTSAGRVGPLFAAIRAAMRGHFVVVDTPPLLLSSETQVLTDVAGQILLVVHAGRSLRDSVKDAVSRVRQTIPIGVVLNGWSPMLPSEKRTYSAFHEYAAK